MAAKARNKKSLSDTLKCTTCTKGHYELTEPALDGRPQFKCSFCGHTCTWGLSGGELLVAIRKKKKTRGY